MHAVSVGSPSNLHYTYDLEKGTVLQVWRGEFLDATPMWHDRGDGSSRPRGSVTLLGDDMLLGKTNGQSKWVADTTGSGYRPKGYVWMIQMFLLSSIRHLAHLLRIIISVVNNQYFERDCKSEQSGKRSCSKTCRRYFD